MEGRGGTLAMSAIRQDLGLIFYKFCALFKTVAG